MNILHVILTYITLETVRTKEIESFLSNQCNVPVLDAKQALQIVLGTTGQGDTVYCFLSCTCLV